MRGRRFRGVDAVNGLFLSPLIIPAVVFGIAMLQFINATGLYNTFASLVLAHLVVITPFAIRTLISALRAVPIEVEWAATQSSVFLVAIQVEALDRARLLSDVTRVLSDQHVNILSAAVQTSRDRVAMSRFTFEMGDPKHLGHVLKAVRGVEGVYDVYRVTSAKK